MPGRRARGRDDGPSPAAEARTSACRHYVLVGGVDHLPVTDYRLYRGVVGAALALEAQVVRAPDSAGPDGAVIAKYGAAAAAVRDHCG